MLVYYIELAFFFDRAYEPTIKLAYYSQIQEILFTEILPLSPTNLQFFHHHTSLNFFSHCNRIMNLNICVFPLNWIMVYHLTDF